MSVCLNLLCPVMQSVFLLHDQCFQEKTVTPGSIVSHDKPDKEKKPLKIDE